MDIKTTLCGIELKNPVMPASGPLSGDDEKLIFLDSQKVGAVVTKTISVKAAVVPRPCIISEKDTVFNCELWSEYDYMKWKKEFLPNIKNKLSVPLIVSLGYSEEELEFLIPQFEEYADIFEISTHYCSTEMTVLEKTVRAIRKNTKKPFLMKMSPHTPDPVLFAKTAKENGAGGIVIMNSLGPSLKVDLKNHRVLLGNEKGQVWASGSILKSLSLAMIRTVSQSVEDFDIVGTGGISNAGDVLEFMLCGAKAVQLVSGALINGKDIFARIISALEPALTENGFSSIMDLINTSIEPFSPEYLPKYPVIDAKRCTLCGLCERVCPYFAVKVGDSVSIDKNRCFGCGLCQSRCPVKAITGVW